jgi:hypothetical protein
MQRETVMRVLNDPVAQELIWSDIPARVAYTGMDGFPRVVPLGFHWNGTHFVICTVPDSPKVPALRANPHVALTIDTVSFPPHVLLVRGTASLELVDGRAVGVSGGSEKAGRPRGHAGLREGWSS